MLKIYIANLEEYNRGVMLGEWVKLPVTDDKLEEVCDKIQVSNHKEFLVLDYETNVEKLEIEIGIYEGIEELNEVAEQLKSLNKSQIEILEAIFEAYGDEYSIEAAIELIDNVVYYSDCTLEELAEQFVNTGLYGDIPESIINYINYINYAAIAQDLKYENYVETANGVLYYSNANSIII